jgi:hypothetical protein
MPLTVSRIASSTTARRTTTRGSRLGTAAPPPRRRRAPRRRGLLRWAVEDSSLGPWAWETGLLPTGTPSAEEQQPADPCRGKQSDRDVPDHEDEHRPFRYRQDRRLTTGCSSPLTPPNRNYRAPAASTPGRTSALAMCPYMHTTEKAGGSAASPWGVRAVGTFSRSRPRSSPQRDRERKPRNQQERHPRDALGSQAAPLARESPASAGHPAMGREGFEPSTLGLRVPCSTN